MKTIYAGNLPFSVSEDDIRAMFEAYGTVVSVKMITDRDTGRFRGFGFIEMEDDDAASAIKGLDGTEHGDRTLRINEAKERTPRGEGD